jgi:hypothetical protein
MRRAGAQPQSSTGTGVPERITKGDAEFAPLAEVTRALLRVAPSKEAHTMCKRK